MTRPIPMALLGPFLRRVEGVEHEAYPDPASPLGRACTAHSLKVSQYRQLSGWEGMSGAPWTVGCGHTGSDVHPGDVWTDAQIDAALQADLGIAVSRLGHVLEPDVLADLSDCQYAALLSFAYNAGVGAAPGSTAGEVWTIWTDLNLGKWDDVPTQLGRFIFAAHKPNHGLENRRAQEIALWNGMDPVCITHH